MSHTNDTIKIDEYDYLTETEKRCYLKYVDTLEMFLDDKIDTSIFRWKTTGIRDMSKYLADRVKIDYYGKNNLITHSKLSEVKTIKNNRKMLNVQNL